MEIISIVFHAYVYVTIYEFLTDERHKFLKWVLFLVIGITKYVAESFIIAKQLIPFMVCTLLVIYSVCVKSHDSNLQNFKYAITTYGLSYVLDIFVACILAIILGCIGKSNSRLIYMISSIEKLTIIFVLYRFRFLFIKLKKDWILNIGFIATIILLFSEQALRVAFATDNYAFTNLSLACTYLAAIFTILWLMDHYKMAKIQKMYAEDNKQMSQKLHRSKEILPMIANYASSMDAAQDEEMRKKLEAVCHDYGKELGGAEMSAELFDTTGIDLVDLLLKTKITECVEQDIELDVFVGTQIHKDMKRLDIGDGEIARLIGDLLRNAIHAVNGLKNKMILLLIVKDEDEHVLIRIYDSGIPFPPYVLERFGERGNTTWGTGNGLADLMDTLKRVHASIEINTEMAPGDVFTKEICICFDGEDRVKIPHKDI